MYAGTSSPRGPCSPPTELAAACPVLHSRCRSSSSPVSPRRAVTSSPVRRRAAASAHLPEPHPWRPCPFDSHPNNFVSGIDPSYPLPPHRCSPAPTTPTHTLRTLSIPILTEARRSERGGGASRCGHAAGRQCAARRYLLCGSAQSWRCGGVCPCCAVTYPITVPSDVIPRQRSRFQVCFSVSESAVALQRQPSSVEHL